MRQIVQYASTLDEAIEIVLSTPRTFGDIMISDNKILMWCWKSCKPLCHKRAEEGLLYATNRHNTEYMQQFQARDGCLHVVRTDRSISFPQLWRYRRGIHG